MPFLLQLLLPLFQDVVVAVELLEHLSDLPFKYHSFNLSVCSEGSRD